MLTIALTGGIGSGKTQVSDFFSSLGVPVIDTDIISRQLVEPGQTALEQITGYFGNHILLDSGELDRAGLREIIFNNSTARKTLEDILHPAIRDKVQQQLQASTYPYVIIVIPLYIETGQFLNTDRILVVDCPQEIQQNRVVARDNISIEQFAKILQSQATREQRLAVADDVIVNDSDIETLQRKVKQLHEQYLHTSLIK
jgi:dephospho-CoA kinase